MGDRIYDTKLLGFFLSEKECEEVVLKYGNLEGFCDSPSGFAIERVEANVDDFNSGKCAHRISV